MSGTYCIRTGGDGGLDTKIYLLFDNPGKKRVNRRWTRLRKYNHNIRLHLEKALIIINKQTNVYLTLVFKEFFVCGQVKRGFDNNLNIHILNISICTHR